MTRVVRLIELTTLLGVAATSGLAAQSGQELFQTTCIACHTLDTTRLIGPGLAGVLDRRDRSWAKRFIMEPDQMLASGDSIATELLAIYQVPMLNLGITDAQAEALLDFIESGADAAQTGPPPEAARPATEDEIVLGQNLFQGTTRLSNGGPACNSCHEVTNDAVIGGGVLARELTTVFSRLGGPGVRSIISSSPFPVMQRAYLDRPLTDPEVSALVGFLQQADAEQAFHQPRDYGIKLFGAGVLGTLIILALSSLAWRGRLRGSVNQSIYDRQIKST